MLVRAISLLCFVGIVCPLDAAEPIAAGVPVLPAMRSVAAADVALNQYLYVEFPRQLQALENERLLAEAELALVQRRVDSFRPFRSFHQYGATYFVDQTWQIQLLVAEQRVECLRYDLADLWRQRQAVVAQFLAEPAGR